MKYLSALTSQASGSLRGMTASHNAGGAYLRGRTKPVNPRTAKQTVVRNAMTALSTAWSATLTTAQRLSWTVYAQNITWLNSLGQAIKVTGLNAYVSCNTPRLQASLSRIDTGPVVFDRGNFTAPTATVTHSNATLSIAFTNSDAWANATGGAMLVFASTPQNGSINYFQGPYSFVGKILGNGTPPVSPSNFTMAQPAGPVGSQIFLRFEVTQSDGRLSPDMTFPSVSA